MRRARGELYRLRREGKVAGVCAGLADYFGIETWLVRIIFVSGVLFSGPIFILAYIALWFILDIKPGHEKQSKSRKAQRDNFDGDVNAHIRSRFEEKPVVVKETAWQAGEPPRQAFHDIASQYKDLEKRLQNMETYVTSTEFTVSREIDRL